MKTLRVMLCLLLALSLLPAALAAEAGVTEASLELNGGTVRFPRFTQGADEAVLDAWNQAVSQAADLDGLIGQLAAGVSLDVQCRWSVSALRGDVFSCSFEITGLPGGHSWRTVNLDLRTGKTLALPDLLGSGGADRLAVILEEEVFPALSPMLAHRDLLPLPEDFTLDESGLTLYYPITALQTLRDRAGTVRIPWSALAEALPADEDSLWRRAGGGGMVGGAGAEALERAARAGALPGIPVTLGQSVSEVLSAYGLAEDPDLYQGGRMFALEDGAFRGTWVLSDALTWEWNDSVVQGIRTDCADVWGLCTGTTTLEDWRGLLGAPASTLQVDDAYAEAIRSVPGTSDYYVLGGHTLRLHADEDGVLRSIWLLE